MAEAQARSERQGERAAPAVGTNVAAAVVDVDRLAGRLPRARPLPPAGRRARWLIWLVPALALALALIPALRALWRRGPTITISFATAEGLEAHKTAIKYKSVNIGVIEEIDLLPDRSGVRVTAQLSRTAEGLLVADSRFWVVRPRVSRAGVSGIGTLIAGAHIGVDAGTSATRRRDFTGLEAPPTVVSDRRGSRFVLRSDEIGSLADDSPVYLRGLQVGQVTRVDVQGDGSGAAVLEIFIDAPYDRQVRATTRFWNASGVDLTVDARGIKLDTQSMKSVLFGGVAFTTPAAAAGQPAEPGATFVLHPNREAALRQRGGQDSEYLLVFARPVRGLDSGAPVQLLGLEVGEVTAVALDFDAASGDPRTLVTVNLPPERLRLAAAPDAPTGAQAQALLARLVQRGLRARVRADNLLTGRRAVSLDLVPGAAPVKLDWSRPPRQLPTAEGGPGDDLPEAVGRLVARLERVPVEQLARESGLAMRDLRQTLQQTSRLVGRIDGELAPRMGALMGQAQRTLGTVEQALSSEASLQQDLRGALRDMGSAGYALRSLAEYLERHPEALLRGKKEDRP